MSCFCSISGRVGFWITTPGMTDRERKKKTHQDEEGDSGKGDLASLMRYMMEENQKAEARREREAKMFEARLVAAEEKAERRRREDRLAAEEKAEARVEAKKLRKAEEAKKMEEKEKIKEEAAKAETERLRQEQKMMNERAYEQQVALLRLQSDIGGKAAEVHRIEQEAIRKKERAVSGIMGLREGEDVEEFLATSERKLMAGDVPRREWVSVIAAKLGGKVGNTWQDLCNGGEEYDEVKAGLLRTYGYTPKLAGELFFECKSDAIRGLSADQVYARGVQLIRRIVAPQRLAPEAEFSLLKSWVWSIVPKQARLVMDARKVTNAEDLIGALQDYLVMEGERKEGQAAVFGRSFGEVGSRIVTCFKCGKAGHKSYDCEAVGNGLSLQTASGGSSSVGLGFGGYMKGVHCFACGQEGHKSPQCPNKHSKVKVKAEPKDPEKMKRVKGHPHRDTFLEMEVNGQVVSVLLDSGAAISVVPSSMVAQAQYTGESVELRSFASAKVTVLPMAEIPMATENSRWKEVVAVLQEDDEEGESEILYSLDIKSTRGLELIYLAHMEARKKEGETKEKEDEMVEEEEEEDEVVDEEDEAEEEEIGKVCRVRATEILGFREQSPGVAKDPILPEGLQIVSDDFCNNVCVEPFTEGELLEKEPRTAPVFLVGGDVGTAHRRRKEKEKEKEEEQSESVT